MSTSLNYLLENGPEPVQVLLVSSSAELCRRLRERLSDPRWTVREAHSGSDALEKLIESSGHIVLLDTRLPDLDPTEFNDILRTEFPGVQVLPISAQTGATMMGTSAPNRLSEELARILREDGAGAGLLRPAAAVPVVDR